MEKFSVLRFLNSKGENVASIVTPVRRDTQNRDDSIVRHEDKIIVKPSNMKPSRLNGNASSFKEDSDDESIGAPFLFVHDRTSDDLPEIEISNGDLPEMEIGNVELETEDTKAEKKGEDADVTDLDPNIQKSTRSVLFPDNPPYPREHKIKRSRGTADPMKTLEPKTKKSFRSKGTVNPKIKLELNLDLNIERPTISKGAPDPKIIQVNESRRKSDIYNCAICEKVFDHMVKLNGHINMVHSKVEVDKDKMFECPYPDCNYKTSRFDNYTTFHEPSHTGEYKYRCDANNGCTFRSTRRDRLQSHKKGGTKTCPRM